jgi:hypothetical protein
MTATKLPYPIGTLTDKGFFLGMSTAFPKLGGYAQLVESEGRVSSTVCNPSIAKQITPEQESDRLTKIDAARERGFFGNTQLTVEGWEVLNVLHALAGKA